MAVDTNPQGFSITDAEVVAEGVTSFEIAASLTTGGPYTAATASIPVSAMTLSGGVYSAKWSALTFSPALKPGTVYFMVAEAINPVGTSGPTAEQQVELLAAPTPPEGFTVA